MKIAITAHGSDCHATVDTRFGRSNYFVLYNQDEKSWNFLPNTPSCEAAHGAGINSGQILANDGVKILITGYVGPKAFRVLQAQKIDMYSLGEITGSVEEALEAYLSGQLKTINSPNALDLKNK
jgi:predicted Fe-Mo cluster-binding NifX family protein